MVAYERWSFREVPLFLDGQKTHLSASHSFPKPDKNPVLDCTIAMHICTRYLDAAVRYLDVTQGSWIIRIDPHYGQICLFYRKYLSTPNFDRCGGFARWGQNKLARANTSKTPLSCLGAGQIFVRVTFYCVFDRRLNLTLIMQQRDRSQRGSADSTRQIFFWLDIWNCPSQSRFLAIVRIDPKYILLDI